jgi:CDGSH-type Zn-finger protein
VLVNVHTPADTTKDESMTDTLPEASPATVKAVRNGPLQVKGAFRLLGPNGEEYDLQGQRIVLLCRCGRSSNQPFCDSSHVRDGFTSNDRPNACKELDEDAAAGLGAGGT